MPDTIVLECALNTRERRRNFKKKSLRLYVIYPWCSTFYLVIVIRLLLLNLYDHATISPIIVVSIIIIVSELAINNDYLITLCVHHTTYIQHCKTHTHCGYISVYQHNEYDYYDVAHRIYILLGFYIWQYFILVLFHIYVHLCSFFNARLL